VLFEINQYAVQASSDCPAEYFFRDLAEANDAKSGAQIQERIQLTDDLLPHMR
jgi:hypothetical protein